MLSSLLGACQVPAKCLFTRKFLHAPSRKTNLIVEAHYQDGNEETGIDRFLRNHGGGGEFGKARWAYYDNKINNPRPKLVFSEYARSASKALSTPSKNSNWPEVIVDSVALEIRDEYGMPIRERLTQLKQWSVETRGVAICYSSQMHTINAQNSLLNNFPYAIQTISDVILQVSRQSAHPQPDNGNSIFELLRLYPNKKISQHSTLLYADGTWPVFS